MEHSPANSAAFQVHPLTPRRWTDFEKPFGSHGAYGECWCMWWRTTRREFEMRKGEGNRLALKAIVNSGLEVQRINSPVFGYWFGLTKHLQAARMASNLVGKEERD